MERCEPMEEDEEEEEMVVHAYPLCSSLSTYF
jgi:hypothetical protein